MKNVTNTYEDKNGFKTIEYDDGSKTTVAHFIVDGFGLTRQLRDFVREGRIDIAVKIFADSGAPIENLKLIVQGKKHIINVTPKELAIVDCSNLPDLTQEILQYTVPYLNDLNFELLNKAIDLPDYAKELMVERYEHFSRSTPSEDLGQWCWITRGGGYISCGYTKHAATIAELAMKGLIPREYTEADQEKIWIKVTLSGIYCLGNITAKQILALRKLLEKHKKFFFGEEKNADIKTSITINNCHGAYLDEKGNVKLNIGRWT